MTRSRSFTIISFRTPPGRTVDVQLARAAGASEVLEIGCGTGRQSLALARAGVCVTAVDISAEMLAVLRAKMRRFGNAIATITLVRADQRSIVLGRRFPLVLATGGTIQHALTAADWHQALCRMRDHVAPDGRIAFDVAAADRRLAEGRFRRNYRAFSAAFSPHPALDTRGKLGRRLPRPDYRYHPKRF